MTDRVTIEDAVNLCTLASHEALRIVDALEKAGIGPNSDVALGLLWTAIDLFHSVGAPPETVKAAFEMMTTVIAQLPEEVSMTEGKVTRERRSIADRIKDLEAAPPSKKSGDQGP